MKFQYNLSGGMRLKRDLSDNASCLGSWGLREPLRRLGDLSAVANILIVQPEALVPLLTGGGLPMLGLNQQLPANASQNALAGAAFRDGMRWVELRADYRKGGDPAVWKSLAEHPAARGR